MSIKKTQTCSTLLELCIILIFELSHSYAGKQKPIQLGVWFSILANIKWDVSGWE